ncbi:hypothetical protein R69749_04529 [Paraburkholderia domus]|nr:hypothetical protein R69749_04529 [Paraburkholderia domus]
MLSALHRGHGGGNPFHQQAESVGFVRKLGVQPEPHAPIAEGRNNLLQN